MLTAFEIKKGNVGQQKGASLITIGTLIEMYCTSLKMRQL